MPKRRPRQKDYQDLLLDEKSGSRDADHDARGGTAQRFGKRSKHYQHNKTLRTAADRMADARLAAEKKALPIGEIVQVHSLYASVEDRSTGKPRGQGEMLLCTSRRTMRKVIAEELGEVCVGDLVRYRRTGGTANLTESETVDGRSVVLPEGVIEAVEPRKTILMRVDSFDERKLDPIVANAEQFLIVVSLHNPFPRWGLVDRMLVAALAGGLKPIVVVNKADLREEAEDLPGTEAAVEHYRKLGHRAFFTSIVTGEGLDELRDTLAGTITVLAGHSGVGKSSLVTAVDPGLDLRVGDVSEAHSKGRHTTTSARRYLLDDPRGGTVVDTPGVKVFGLARIEAEDLETFFPDITDDTAPEWRRESFERIRASLEGEGRD